MLDSDAMITVQSPTYGIIEVIYHVSTHALFLIRKHFESRLPLSLLNAAQMQ